MTYSLFFFKKKRGVDGVWWGGGGSVVCSAVVGAPRQCCRGPNLRNQEIFPTRHTVYLFSNKERPFFLLSQEKSLFRGSVSLEQRLVCPSRQCSRLAGKEHERNVARAGQRLSENKNGRMGVVRLNGPRVGYLTSPSLGDF